MRTGLLATVARGLATVAARREEEGGGGGRGEGGNLGGDGLKETRKTAGMKDDTERHPVTPHQVFIYT